MKQQYEKYIICPDCHIGGYDFCDTCLGAGGYTIKVDKDPSLDKGNIQLDKIKSIKSKLDLIVQRGIWNDKIEEKLVEYFTSLSESAYSEEVLRTLKRILKIRKNNYGKKLLKLYTNKTKNLEAIKFTFSKKNITVHGDEKYFTITDDNNIVYKLTTTQFVSFSSHLLKGFIDNLGYNSTVKFENNETFSNYKKNDIDAISNADSMYFQVINEDEIQNFVIKKSKIKSVCISYINMLHQQNANGWYYIHN